MNSPIEAIKKAVAENRTGDALSRLLELTQSNKQLHDAIHIVLAEFNDLTSQRLKGTLDNSEATRRLNVVHDKILVALGAFDSQGRVMPGKILSKNYTPNVLKRLFAYFFGMSSLMLAICYFVEPRSILFKAWTPVGFFGMIGVAFSLLGFIAFIAYILAVVVSASKK